MGKLVMGYWDCPVCGTQGIRGDTVNCPSCGRARGDVQFYMKDHAESQTREQGDTADIEYVDEEKAKTASRNPDWYCSFCNSLNSDNAQFCANCGASRESSEANYFDMLKKKKAQEATMAPPQPTAQELAQTRTAPKSKRGLIFLLVAIVAIVGLFMYMNGDKTAGDLTVSALSWERNIQIEENVQYSESGWDLPDGAELTSQRQEIHHYDSVLDHYENVEVQRSRRVIDHYETYYTYNDLGNGNFEQVENQRPVYETEYYTETVQQPSRLAGAGARRKRANRRPRGGIPLHRHGQGRQGNRIQSRRGRLAKSLRRPVHLHHVKALRRQPVHRRRRRQQDSRCNPRPLTSAVRGVSGTINSQLSTLHYSP